MCVVPTAKVACTPLLLRLALAASFLAAVADRFGLWGAPGAPGLAWVRSAGFAAQKDPIIRPATAAS